MDVQAVDKILEQFPDTTGNLIAILHEVQNHFHYLPEAELRYIAKKIDVPITQIYSITAGLPTEPLPHASPSRSRPC